MKCAESFQLVFIFLKWASHETSMLNRYQIHNGKTVIPILLWSSRLPSQLTMRKPVRPPLNLQDPHAGILMRIRRPSFTILRAYSRRQFMVMSRFRLRLWLEITERTTRCTPFHKRHFPYKVKLNRTRKPIVKFQITRKSLLHFHPKTWDDTQLKIIHAVLLFWGASE